MVLICFTTAEGDIEVELLGCTRTSAFSDATHTGTGIMNLLTKTLKISDSNARCDSRTGLRCAHYVPASSRDPLKVHEAESRSVHRGMFLTCMVSDRAYSGFTGTRLDEWLCEKLGVRGILGRARRVGMADLFHCFDGCAKKVWEGNKKERKKRAEKKKAEKKALQEKRQCEQDAGQEEEDEEAQKEEAQKEETQLEHDEKAEGSCTSGDEEELSPDDPDALPLVAWDRICRRLRVLLCRGQGKFHLDNAYARCGIHGRPKIIIPGTTRMIVYSSKYLKQSFAHWAVRYEALCAMASALEAHATDPKNKSRKRHRKVRETIVRAGQRLANARLVLPTFLVHLCFSLPHGFIEGALQVQKTEAIFFIRTCVSIACVGSCGISGYCRQRWRSCRLEPLPHRRATMARSAESQGSVALRAACSKDLV